MTKDDETIERILDFFMVKPLVGMVLMDHEQVKEMVYHAIIQERTACAKVADDYVEGFDEPYKEIGTEIAGGIEKRTKL
jgi:hypothetical protein